MPKEPNFNDHIFVESIALKSLTSVMRAEEQRQL